MKSFLLMHLKVLISLCFHLNNRKKYFNILFNFTVRRRVSFRQKRKFSLKKIVKDDSGFRNKKISLMIGKYESTLNRLDRLSDVSSEPSYTPYLDSSFS